MSGSYLLLIRAWRIYINVSVIKKLIFRFLFSIRFRFMSLRWRHCCTTHMIEAYARVYTYHFSWTTIININRLTWKKLCWLFIVIVVGFENTESVVSPDSVRIYIYIYLDIFQAFFFQCKTLSVRPWARRLIDFSEWFGSVRVSFRHNPLAAQT